MGEGPGVGQRWKEGSVERASLRETQDTGCKGSLRQGVCFVVKPYWEYRRSISFLALQKKKEKRTESEEEGARRRGDAPARRIGLQEFFLISLKNSLSFAAAVRY